MTNKEVINFLNQVRKILLDDKSWLESSIQPINEAFDMAINALTAKLETPDKRTEMHACDLIDRQALMKEFSDFVRVSNNSDFAPTPTWNDAVSLVGSMPPAQPEQFVKGCRNCKYGKYNDFWKTHFCYNPNECTEWNLWEPNAQLEIILCEGCKHRPIMRNGHIVPPEGDEKCPCLCEDPFYSWIPEDNFFCANGERREE